jgi:ABC-type Mn2+/Zn2+ transport system ATPase subunit
MEMGRSPIVALEGVALGYGREPVIEGVSLAIEHGDFLALVGPNGAGKTTVLRALAGILDPIRGTRLVGGSGLAVGYVPQERELDPVFPLSAFDVALQGRIGRLGPWRRIRHTDLEKVRDALAVAGVKGLERAQFSELSGGQKQRVLVARALAGEPTVLLLDEPTSGTDPAAERALVDMLQSLNVSRQVAIVIATHNLGLIGNYARRIALIDRHRGLFRLGASAEVLTEETLTRLYGQEIRVRTVDGWRTILAGGTS